jgi:hypothetical protein
MPTEAVHNHRRFEPWLFQRLRCGR